MTSERQAGAPLQKPFIPLSLSLSLSRSLPLSLSLFIALSPFLSPISLSLSLSPPYLSLSLFSLSETILVCSPPEWRNLSKTGMFIFPVTPLCLHFRQTYWRTLLRISILMCYPTTFEAFSATYCVSTASPIRKTTFLNNAQTRVCPLLRITCDRTWLHS